MQDIVKCAILATVALVPIFIFANELSGDEFQKSGVGLAAAALVYVAIRLLEKQMSSRRNNDGRSA